MILSIGMSIGASAVKTVLVTMRPHSLKIPTIGDCRNWRSGEVTRLTENSPAIAFLDRAA
jgi:hypothetical protein